MYYIYGVSVPSLLIESTDSMIIESTDSMIIESTDSMIIGIPHCNYYTYAH